MRRLVLNYLLFLVFVVAVVWFGAAPFIERVGSAPFREDYERYYRELMRGGFAMVEADLQRRPPEGWPARIDSVQADFGYPIALTDTASVELPDRQRARLARGELIIGPGYDQFWRRVADGPAVLVMGPFPAPEVGRSVNLWIAALVLLVVALAAVAWTLPFARELGRFGRTAAAFGDGALDARVQLPRHSPLRPLADSFDRMAARVQGLVASHRDLTNAVAHELRTPLSRVRFGLEMAAVARDDDDRRRHVVGIERDLQDLEALIDDLLAHARYDRTAPAVEVRAVDLAEWFDSVVDGLRAEVGATLDTRAEGVRGRSADFDPVALRRAVDNLVHNADRYGGGRIVISLSAVDDTVTLTVEDDGPGIAPEHRTRVFDPFVRIESSRHRGTGGHGLGLSIVRAAVQAHGGSVSVDDATLGGCRFTVRWPRHGRAESGARMHAGNERGRPE